MNGIPQALLEQHAKLIAERDASAAVVPSAESEAVQTAQEPQNTPPITEPQPEAFMASDQPDNVIPFATPSLEQQELERMQQRYRTLQGMNQKLERDIQEQKQQLQVMEKPFDVEVARQKYNLPDEMVDSPELVQTMECIAKVQAREQQQEKQAREQQEREQQQGQRLDQFRTELDLILPDWRAMENHPAWAHYAHQGVLDSLFSAAERFDTSAAVRIYQEFSNRLQMQRPAAPAQTVNPSVLRDIRPQASASPPPAAPRPAPVYNQQEHTALLADATRGVLPQPKQARLAELTAIYNAKLPGGTP